MTKSKFLTGLTVSVLAGAAVGVLLAPKPGRDIRESVGRRTAKVTNRVGRGLTGLDTLKSRWKRERAGEESLGEIIHSKADNGVKA